MARRRKHRTHLGGSGASKAGAVSDGSPKSFIIKHGQVGSSLAQLVRDMRKVMEPNTASRLRERARNKLKDYLTLAPALHVTHLLAFTLTPIAPSLRLVRLPAGPTLSFRVERYSLVKDVTRISRRVRAMGMEYLSPPLLVLASFPPPSPTTPRHLTLLMKSLQSLFPPLSPKTITLSSARRVVLVSYNTSNGTVDWRHYIITVKPYGVSKRVRKVIDGGPKGLPDLGNEKDVADFILGKTRAGASEGYESAASSASSAAGDDGDAVSLADDYVGRNNRKGQRRAVRLDEVGPRMELKLIKITEGVPGKDGAVIYHEFVKKSKKEVAKQQAVHAEKEQLRKKRREEQERNVQRKKVMTLGVAMEDGDEGEDKEAHGDDDQNEEDEDSGTDAEQDHEAGWDENEEISDGNETDADSSAEGDSESDGEEQLPAKKARTRSNG